MAVFETSSLSQISDVGGLADVVILKGVKVFSGLARGQGGCSSGQPFFPFLSFCTVSEVVPCRIYASSHYRVSISTHLH